jgi:hypothetical protein
MTMTRGSRPPPSYSQTLANNRNAPARPSVITCAPPASSSSSSWGERSSDVKGSNKDENGRQGHRRELLSGEFILYCSVETEIGKHDLYVLQSSSVSNWVTKLFCFIFILLVPCNFTVIKPLTFKNLHENYARKNYIFICII